MSAASADRPALDVLVIGGGQAGLAMGYQLSQLGRRFAIVDAAPEIGHVWRSRWDSLRLFTSGRYDTLPGLPFPAAADAYPGKDEAAAYLQTYAAQFRLPVRLNTAITSLTRTDARYVAKAGQQTVQARQVVLATGPFHVPFIPTVSTQLPADVPQIHSIDYRRPDNLPLGRVLVVGGSNSGSQIALELSTTRTVELSVGQRLPAIPQRPLGRDVWSWATALHLDRVTAKSRLGRRLSKRDQIIGDRA
jgi:putative flavoprotein involved in K+ transport